MAEEAGAFAFPDVVEAITTKMIRRHPHVFGDADARAAGAAKGFWEKAKAEEKQRARRRRRAGVLDGVPAGLPALMRALKLQEKASTVGFDWNDPKAVLAKLREEIGEIEAELAAAPASAERVADEVGDLLFAAVNLARHLKVDPDQALRRTNAKFTRRFGGDRRRACRRGPQAEGRQSRRDGSALAERPRRPTEPAQCVRYRAAGKGLAERRLPLRRDADMGGRGAVRVIDPIENLAELVEPVELAEGRALQPDPVGVPGRRDMRARSPPAARAAPRRSAPTP